MTKKTIIYLALLMTLTSCVLFNDLYYTPKKSNNYYFPLESIEFSKRKHDCIEKKEFPCNFNKPNDTLTEFVNQWYSKHLKSMKEPILYKLRNENKKIIRFTHLGTWSNPFSYKIENNNGQITVTYNITKGLGGYNAGRRIKHEQKIITQKKWNVVLQKIDNINFWNITTHDPNMILDGEEWILEVLINKKYHFVTRNSPFYDNVKYTELCKLIMNAMKE